MHHEWELNPEVLRLWHYRTQNEYSTVSGGEYCTIHSTFALYSDRRCPDRHTPTRSRPLPTQSLTPRHHSLLLPTNRPSNFLPQLTHCPMHSLRLLTHGRPESLPKSFSDQIHSLPSTAISTYSLRPPLPTCSLNVFTQ